MTSTPVDITVGVDAGANSRLDHVSGIGNTGNGNWMFVGRNGGTGVYNLANTAQTGGTHTNFGKGSGTMNVKGRLYIGGNSGSGSNGTVNVNTTGSLVIGTQLEIGTNTSVGTLNIDAGSVSTADWTEIGNGVGSTGNLRMSAGSLTKTGNNQMIIGANGSTGNATVSGGTITVNNDIWVANNTGSTGTLTLSGGLVTNGGWAVIGRKDTANVGVGGVGTVNMSGGTWSKTGTTTNFIIGASGNGTMNMSGGIVDVSPSTTADRGITWIAEQNSCTGSLTLSGTAEFRTARFTVGVGGGTTGTFNLDGGIAKTAQITGGVGNSTVNFNGTEIIATANQALFVNNVGNAIVKAGNLKMNTNGFNVTIPQLLAAGSPSGGIVKTGAGTFTLTGTNTYTGGHTITAGKLVVTNNSLGGGAFTVADGATFGVTQTVDAPLNTSAVTFGTAGASSLDVDLGAIPDNPSFAPLNISGALTLNGPVTINISDAMPAVGVIPLITYVGPKAGTGSFVLGTLPNGVIGTLSDNGSGLVSLNVTSVSLPQWTGTINGNWNNITQNWVDLITGFSVNYADPAPVVFGDAEPDNTITLNQTVAPSKVTFSSSGSAYTVTGTGKITGPATIVKSGAQTATLATTNDFTGVVTISGGTLAATTLANGGSPSSIGSASSAPSNIVLDGGALGYTGPTTTIDRGFTINAANSGITTTNDLTLGGVFSNQSGNLIKSGAGNLILNRNAAIALGTTSPGVRVQGGTLTLTGTGAQVVSVAGEFYVGNIPDVTASLVLNNTSLVTGNFLALSRGNGDNGVSNMTATNSVIQTASFSTGYNNNLANNASEAFVTINNSTWTNAGVTYLSESAGSTSVMTMNGTSQLSGAGNMLLSRNAGTISTLTLKDSSSITKTTGYFAVGAGGTCTLNLQDNASLVMNVDDFNVGDGGTANGTFNLSGTASASVSNFYVGKGANGGTGLFSQTGGSLQSSTFVTMGRFAGSIGTANISAGTLSHNGTGNVFYVGQEGSATLNVSGTGSVVSHGTQVLLSGAATANGIVNLNGGTFTLKQITEGAGGGNSEFYFNGGVLKADTGANAAFMQGIDVAMVKSAGGAIDTNGQTLTVAQNLSDGGGNGGIAKQGAGTLLLNGSNGYSGTTTVSAGTLGGTGSVAGSLVVSSGTTLAPGTAVGTFTAGATTLTGTYLCDVSGATADKLAVNGALTISPGAVLDFNAVTAPSGPALVIASYTSLSGSFTVQHLPAGYHVEYAYNNGISSNNVALVSSTGSPYGTWTSLYFPGVTDPAIIGTAADPDKDGSPNSLEFALGGVPNNPADGPKVFQFVADSSDAGPEKELLMTIAVRGTPTFGAGPAPTVTSDGFIYQIRGSLNLGAFAAPVSEVSPVAPPAPNTAPPSGYAWRTFSLDGSNNLPSKGFLRVSVEKAP